MSEIKTSNFMYVRYDKIGTKENTIKSNKCI
jgi:hypothetical protein